MKHDLSQSDVSGTPFDWMLHMLVRAAEIFEVAVLVVVLVALACGGGSKP